jgi:hypothetical protein
VSALAGCGVAVPPLTELRGSSAEAETLIHDIVHSVHCEVFNAVRFVVGAKDVEKPTTLNKAAAFMDGWGAQVLLTLQIDEQTALNPIAAWQVPSPVNSLFTLGAGATVSSHATRIEKINFFYDVDALRGVSDKKECKFEPAPGSLLIQSDLGLADWLSAEAISVNTLEFGSTTDPNTVLKQNVLQHEVKFDVVTSGNITPGWKLARLTVDQSGTLFSTSRERVHDLLITLGPKLQEGTLTTTAEGAHLASQINLRTSSSQ